MGKYVRIRERKYDKLSINIFNKFSKDFWNFSKWGTLTDYFVTFLGLDCNILEIFIIFTYSISTISHKKFTHPHYISRTGKIFALFHNTIWKFPKIFIIVLKSGAFGQDPICGSVFPFFFPFLPHTLSTFSVIVTH